MKKVNLILLLLLVWPLIGFSQGKIEQSRKELRQGKSQKSETPQSKNDGFNGANSYGSDDDDSFQNFLLEAAFKLTLFVTYYAVVGDYRSEDHLHNNLSEYPYSFKQGNYINSNADSSITKIRLDVENNFLFGLNDIYGDHLKVKIRPLRYFYFQADFIELAEYDYTRDKFSTLPLFNFNFCYDRLRFEKFNLGWMLGVNYVGQDINKAGFTFGLNTEFVLAKAFSFSGEAKWSSINSVRIQESEACLKYHRKKHFFSLGYEHYKIGTPNYDYLTLGAGIYF